MHLTQSQQAVFMVVLYMPGKCRHLTSHNETFSASTSTRFDWLTRTQRFAFCSFRPPWCKSVNRWTARIRAQTNDDRYKHKLVFKGRRLSAAWATGLSLP